MPAADQESRGDSKRGGSPLRVLVAPDSFKDALSAAEVAEAIAAGVAGRYPHAQIERCPLSDGGEGAGGILAHALSAMPQTATVLDPLGRPIAARWWRSADGFHGVVELAEASGLQRLRADERSATRTTSWGTGQLIHTALAAGCRHVSICVGGSAMVDGGAGALQALGWRLLDTSGRVIAEPVSGGRLHEVAGLRWSPLEVHAALHVLCDVRNPLIGPRGAARVFAPQKGASPEEVERLERGLEHWASLLAAFTGHDVSRLEHGGAAGGIAAGLRAGFEAQLRSGFEVIAARLKLAERIAAADVVITGEGRLDAQSAGGKVVSGVARLATAAGRPVIVLCGACDDPAGQAGTLGLRAVRVVTAPGTSLEEALPRTRAHLTATAETLDLA